MNQTPKEKAIALYHAFNDRFYMYAVPANVIAIICVDEIIKANPTKANLVPALRGSKLIHESSIEYWQQVKEELQKM